MNTTTNNHADKKRRLSISASAEDYQHIFELLTEMKAERDQALSERDQSRSERDQARSERDQAKIEHDQAKAKFDAAQKEQHTMKLAIINELKSAFGLIMLREHIYVLLGLEKCSKEHWHWKEKPCSDCNATKKT